jgi:hypothetical protein
LAEPGRRWSIGQSRVRPSGVVMVEPIGKSVLARLGGSIGLCVGPLAQAGLDEPLGLAVGARGVGLGAQVAQPQCAASLPPIVAAISRAIVGDDPLDSDAVAGKPGQRAFEKRHRAFLALVAQHLAVGQARGIINADVEVFPAGAAPAVAGIAGDAVANRLDAAELLDIDMDQLAGPLALVAHRRWFRFERRQPAQPDPAQELAHRRDRHAELPRDRRAAQPLSPQPLDLDNPLGRGAVPAALWRRTVISQGRRTATEIAGQPMVGAAGGQSDSPAARAASGTLQPCCVMRSTNKSRPCGVSRAFLWTFIRSVPPNHTCESGNPQPDRVPPDEQPS